MLFLFLAGPVGAVSYKAINTLDSMVGYKDAHYLYFGRCAARLDDIANLVPARLTALCIAAAAGLLTGKGLESLRTCFADARKHESPNAGYPEAAMAGALGVELGGDAYYGGELEHRPRLGNGKAALDVPALHTSRILMWIATAMALAVVTALRWFI
jgi:adenosylcobinamide-phosphate synthase